MAHETEQYLLRMEDFIRTERPDGSTVLTHPFLQGEIEVGARESPLWLFPKLKLFSQKNAVLLNPELARLAKVFGDGPLQDEKEDLYPEDDSLD